jgi:hypothetical protein
MHDCPAAGKWSMAVWEGPNSTAVTEALDTCGANAVVAAYSLDSETQTWSRYFAGRPEISNLTALDNLQGVMALGGVGASASALPASSGQQETYATYHCPQPGKWATAVWGGPDSIGVDLAMATCGPVAVTTAYRIDPETQAWLRWFAGRPDISNMARLDNMQGVIALAKGLEEALEVHDQDVSGRIGEDQVWSGTIHVTGDIFVPEGTTLTIEPGTMVKMAANSDDQHSGEEHVKDELTWDKENNVWKDLSATKEYTQSHIGVGIEGTLIAVGTPDSNIVFTSDSDSPYYLDWDHMVIKNGTVKHCIFEWAHAGPDIANGVFSDNIVRHMFWGGIHAYNGSPLIESNAVEDIGHEGIDTLRSSAIIRNNVIRKTRTSGIVTRYAGYDGTPTLIEGNTIVNAGPIHLQMYSKAVVRNNILLRGDPEDDADTISYLGYQLPPIDGAPAGVGSGAILLMDFVDVTVTNNVQVGNGISYSLATGTYALQEGFSGAEADKPERVDIRNNIIYGAAVPIGSETFENFTIEYNLFWSEPSSELQTQLPYFSDQTNIVADPLFVSVEGRNFHLTSESPAVDQGDPGIKDKDGSRSEMGAYGGPHAR